MAKQGAQQVVIYGCGDLKTSYFKRLTRWKRFCVYFCCFFGDD